MQSDQSVIEGKFVDAKVSDQVESQIVPFYFQNQLVQVPK